MEMEVKNLATEIIPARQRASVGPRKVAAETTEQAKAEVIDRKDLSYQARVGSQLVRGRFVNDETPGGRFSHVFRKYKGPIKTYHYKDQEICEIPLAVAQHLNENCKTPIYGHSKDEDGNPIEIITGWKKRVHFESLEFSVVGGSDFYAER
jgi:hypothetical protein